ncbi:MAG: hypothetical protein Q8K89_09015 [Actinomycetota bacterium]|nr:hypothetical protein [Actinomycetota bacterium]
MVDSFGKRAPRAFEPPPWERQQFDELAAAKQVKAESAQETPAEKEPADETPADAGAGAAKDEGASPKPEGMPKDKLVTKLDEVELTEMLAQLAAEEPHTNQGLWQAGVVASVGLGSIGLMVLIFGLVGLARTAKAGPVGVAGGAILVVFGLGMIALAIWLVVRTLKQRGVL